MTCGIYMIKNKNTTQMYIEQSVNIERRYTQHCNGDDRIGRGQKHIGRKHA